MRRVRVIPTLLVDGSGGLVKTIRFGKRTYIGDPINAVKIFNDKFVDELVLLDIDATRQRREPNYSMIEDIVSGAFMPIGYGGGIGSKEQAARLFGCGIEKVVMASAIFACPSVIEETANRFGSQSVVVCLDVKKNWPFGYKLANRNHGRNESKGLGPAEMAQQAVKLGAGELIVNTIHREGTYRGFDLELIRSIADSVPVPVIACGGAREPNDIVRAIKEGHASAVAAGSMFVYQSSTRGVLISYPKEDELYRIFSELDAS